MSNNPNNSDFGRDLLGLMIVCAVIGGPALVVAWAIIKLMLGILF